MIKDIKENDICVDKFLRIIFIKDVDANQGITYPIDGEKIETEEAVSYTKNGYFYESKDENEPNLVEKLENNNNFFDICILSNFKVGSIKPNATDGKTYFSSTAVKGEEILDIENSIINKKSVVMKKSDYILNISKKISNLSKVLSKYEWQYG